MPWRPTTIRGCGRGAGGTTRRRARIVRGDRNLRRWFTEAEVATIAEAAEDHRASSGRPPRTIYGRIVAEADRVIDCETTLRRTVQYGLEHAPELDREGQFAVLPNICGRSTAKAGICVCGCPNRKTPPVWTSCVPLSATTGSCVCGSTNSTTTNFAARRDHCRFPIFHTPFLRYIVVPDDASPPAGACVCIRGGITETGLGGDELPDGILSFGVVSFQKLLLGGWTWYEERVVADIISDSAT